MKRHSAIVTVVFLVCGTFFLILAEYATWAQTTVPKNAQDPNSAANAINPFDPISSAATPEKPVATSLQEKLAAATAKLNQAASDEEKQQAQSALERLLSDYFDQDLSARGKDLEELKKRVTELERHLEKRRAAKKEIVALQLQVVLKEADGFGFFSDPVSGLRAAGRK